MQPPDLLVTFQDLAMSLITCGVFALAPYPTLDHLLGLCLGVAMLRGRDPSVFARALPLHSECPASWFSALIQAG